MEEGNEIESSMSRPLLDFPARPFSSSTDETPMEQESSNVIAEKNQLESNTVHHKKLGGWKTIPFIVGNESFERLASFGMTANFMVYLTREFHLEQVFAANILNIWHGANNFVPLVGAYIADAYVGRFLTIAVSSFFSLLGMIALSSTAWIPGLHPPHCTDRQQAASECVPANKIQLAMLIMALGLLSIGSGGLRPCSAPFGVDQFDTNTDEGKKQVGSFFNWYYGTSALIILFSSTVMVFIQDAVSWEWGFGIPTAFMFCSIVLFFLGMTEYVYLKPQGSIFSCIARVSVAAYIKRKIELPVYDGRDGVFYNPLPKGENLPRLPYTHQLSWLSKAAVINEGDDIKPNGETEKKWRLCTIQQVEEVKCIVRIIPLWASGIISYVALTQQGTFVVSQALKMDRHLGSKFQIPAASMSLVSYATLILWIPIYDRIVVPALRKITRHEGGITVLQRIGIGIVFSILTMVVSGLVERARRDSANKHPEPLGVAPMSVLWLAPQLVMMGFCEAFYIIGLVEFFNMEFPEHFRTLGNSLFSFSMAGANYLSVLLVTVIHRTTKTSDGGPDWLTNDINKGRLDYYFHLIAALGTLNLLYFVFCARRYHYKDSSSHHEEEEDHLLEIAEEA